MGLLKGALFALAVGWAFLPAHGSPPPDLTLRGEIRDSDHQTYRLVPFDVPQGVRALAIDFDYSGREHKTVIDLGLVGPGEQFETAFRGWSGGSKRAFAVSMHDATPSYHPGPIAPGRWHVVLGVPNVRTGQISEYTVRIRFDRDDSRIAASTPLSTEARWYRGDLHMHSGHSDGSCDSKSGSTRVPCPLFLTLDAAATRGLDFVAVTEHNTNSHVRELTALQPYFDRMLLISGMEITTFQGHANAFNVTQPIDFRLGSDTVPDWNTLLSSADALGAIVSINHPRVPSGEICMGCGWLPKTPVDYGLIAAVEVVNGHDIETPISGIPFWHERLQQGTRLTAIGGSDTHDVTSQKKTYPLPGQIGIPTTVVYAHELSARSITDGIRSGKVFVDTSGTTDRLLELTGMVSDRAASMGDSVQAPAGTRMRWNVAVENVPGGEIEIIHDGRIMHDIPSTTINGTDHTMSFEQRSDGKRHWIRVNVRDAEGKLALIGNPIYLNWQ